MKNSWHNISKVLIAFSVLLLVCSGKNTWGQENNPGKGSLQEFAAANLLSKAREFQKENELSKAVQELIVITDYFPEYGKIDVVFKELGDLLIEMELYSAANKIFEHLIREYRNGPMVPYALYGLERINNLLGRHYRALQLYGLLQEKFPQANVGDGKYYHAGQSFLALEEFDKAIATFDRIKGGGEFRGYAFYSRALANFKKKILPPPSRI